MAYNYNPNSKGLSLKCAGPLQLVVTILHYIEREEKSVGNNRPVVCRPAPEKASSSEQIVHNMLMRALSEERSTLH